MQRAGDRCPRCGAETAGAPACARCGLRREHRERFVEDTALPSGVAPLWDDVLARWDEAAPHAIFLEACVQAEVLDRAAARYRALAAEPARAERCRASLDRIVALAEAGLKRGAADGGRVARNKRIIFAAALAVMFAFLGLIVWAVLQR